MAHPGRRWCCRRTEKPGARTDRPGGGAPTRSQAAPSAGLILEIIQHYYRAVELQQHLVEGTLPRTPLAPDSTVNVLERRRLARRARRKA